MEAALSQARLALAAGEVPVGAVLVAGDQIIARAFNQPISATDPTAHAEVLVVREAARVLGNYPMTDATVYVTGALVSTLKALELPGLNHRFLVISGVLEDECRSIIQEFFRERRRAGVEGTGKV